MVPLASFDKQVSTGETNEILLELASRLVSRINATTTRERIAGCIASGDLLSLCNLDPAYAELTVNDALTIRQIQAFFGKRGDLDLGVDRRRAAQQTFEVSEEACRYTNECYRERRLGRFSFLPGVEGQLHAASRKISAILGDVPSLSALRFRFGPGATTQVQKRMASARRKLGQTLACSEEMIPLVKDVIAECPLWAEWQDTSGSNVSNRLPVEIHHGKLSFVPKSFKTDRAIVVEPMLNSFVQLGINDYMVKRLSMAGIDLSDQRRNQRLAREGSITGALATLDLPSAR